MDAKPAAIPFTFVDRGDPAAYDFTTNDFTKDSAYHDLDLSSIVGANACTVLLNVMMRLGTTNEEIMLRTKGNSNDYNVAQRKGIAANTDYRYGMWVKTDANGVIQYRCTAGTYSTLNLTIRGWLI